MRGVGQAPYVLRALWFANCVLTALTHSGERKPRGDGLQFGSVAGFTCSSFSAAQRCAASALRECLWTGSWTGSLAGFGLSGCSLRFACLRPNVCWLGCSAARNLPRLWPSDFPPNAHVCRWAGLRGSSAMPAFAVGGALLTQCPGERMLSSAARRFRERRPSLLHALLGTTDLGVVPGLLGYLVSRTEAAHSAAVGRELVTAPRCDMRIRGKSTPRRTCACHVCLHTDSQEATQFPP